MVIRVGTARTMNYRAITLLRDGAYHPRYFVRRLWFMRLGVICAPAGIWDRLFSSQTC